MKGKVGIQGQIKACLYARLVLRAAGWVCATTRRTRLLIIDDWGPEPLTAEQRRDLLEIVDDRDGRGSLLITSQLPLNRWHDVVGDMTLGTPSWTVSSTAPTALN
ncbi:MAG: ATP-binding protein [Mycobacteriaceae bacterium]|nr:ATP-binding protein [Mycobacteriaceae bacterium]